MASSVSWYTRNDFPVFRLRENLENLLVEGCPHSPGKGRLCCLANAPPVERRRALAGAEYGALSQLGKGYFLLLEASARRAATPSGAREKAAGGGAFPGFGFQNPTSILHKCVRLCSACLIVLGGIGIPAAHESSPGMRKHTSHAGAGCAERWKTVFGWSG